MCRALKALAEGRFTGDDFDRDRAAGGAVAGDVERRDGVGRVHRRNTVPRRSRVDVDRGIVERTLMFPLVGTVTWTGDLDRTLASEALKATRSGVAPSFAAAFVEDAFDAELLRLVDDDVCGADRFLGVVAPV